MGPGFLPRAWWPRRHKTDPEAPQRWVVIDCETSGLDPEQDELLAIGGVAVRVEGARAEIKPEAHPKLFAFLHRLADEAGAARAAGFGNTA